MKSKGFTLLEVLIALVVLAISLSGLYMMTKTNISTSEFTKDKIALFIKGNELFYSLYAKKEIEATGIYLDCDEKSDIKYKIDKKPLGYDDINQITISLKKDGKKLSFYFYK